MGALLAIAGCAKPAASGFLKPGKLPQVTVGQSSRADVFGALGRPLRTERSGAGESWVYETSNAIGPSPGLVSGAATASSVAGTFVPFAGLVGSGIGLANSTRTPPDTMTLVVKFSLDGVVQDCVQSSTAMPANLPGSDPAIPADCTRP